MKEESTWTYFRYAAYGVGLVLAFIALFLPTSVGIPATYLLLIIAALAAIIFPIIYLIQHPKEGVRTFIGVGFVAVLLLITWAIADDASVFGLVNGEMQELATPSVAKLVGGGVYALLAATAIAVIAIIVGEIRGFFQ